MHSVLSLSANVVYDTSSSWDKSPDMLLRALLSGSGLKVDIQKQINWSVSGIGFATAQEEAMNIKRCTFPQDDISEPSPTTDVIATSFL
jgi:hypothetical protein